MVESTELLDLMQRHRFLDGFDPASLDLLADLAHEVRFDRDQIIFREGDESSFFYLILSGTVALEVTALGHTLRVQTIGEGEELGWSSMMSTDTKQFQARALTTVRALAFDGARLRELCDSDCALGYKIMRRLVQVVAGRLQATRIQLLDMYAPEPKQ